MLLPHFIRWTPQLTISYVYNINLSSASPTMQVSLRIASAVGATQEGIVTLFPGISTDTVSETLLCMCAECISEVVIESGTEVYIPHPFSQPKPSEPWFKIHWYNGTTRALGIKGIPSAWVRILATGRASTGVMVLKRVGFQIGGRQNTSFSP